MLRVGQRVLLPDGRQSGRLVGRVTANNKGVQESIVSEHEVGSQSVQGLWNVEIEGFFHSSRATTPLVVQVPETFLKPCEENRSLDASFESNKCNVCLNSVEIARSLPYEEEFDSILRAFDEEKKNLDNLNTSEIFPHPLYGFAVCRKCFKRLLDYTTALKCLCCGFSCGSEENSSTCEKCNGKLCHPCIERKDFSIYHKAFASCSRCFCQTKFREKIKAIKLSSKSMTVMRPRRDVIREIENGEKIYPTIDNSLAGNMSFLKKAIKKNGMVYDDKVFKEASYFSDKNLTLIKSNIFNDKGCVKADAYIESYFHEFIRDEKGIGYYSELEEKSEFFVAIFQNSYHFPSGEVRNSLLGNLSNIPKVPQNLVLKANVSKKADIIVEGRSGEYFVVPKKPLERGELFCELIGKVCDVAKQEKFVSNKAFWIDSSKTVCFDCNASGNISHFMNFTTELKRANLKIFPFVCVASKMEIRLFAVATKEVQQNEKLVLFVPFVAR